MIPNQWYAVLDPQEVKRGKTLGVTRLGEKLVFWRDETGELSCMPDQCVHRGAALSLGQIIKGRIQCPFHGLEFDRSGKCQCIPANGRTSNIPQAFVMRSYPVVEKHGFIWMWWGGDQKEYPDVPFFKDLDESFSVSRMRDHWAVHYSRAIENQLDVFHLPFVHATTIGRGNRTISDGPIARLENDEMNIWVFSRVEDGSQALRPDDLTPSQKPPQLIFKFPNIWMNRISDSFRLVVAFVPVDECNTMLYLHQYQQMIKVPVLNALFNWTSMRANRVILNQDKRVVLKQRPIKSDLKIGEKLIVQDRPIVLYRTHRKNLIEQSMVK